MHQLSPPINGTEQYLRAIYEQQGELLAEIKGLRADLQPKPVVLEPSSVELKEPALEVESVELKEPKSSRSKSSK